MFIRVSIGGLSVGTTHTFTVYTEINDVIVSGVDVIVTTLPNRGLRISHWKLADKILTNFPYVNDKLIIDVRHRPGPLLPPGESF